MTLWIGAYRSYRGFGDRLLSGAPFGHFGSPTRPAKTFEQPVTRRERHSLEDVLDDPRGVFVEQLQCSQSGGYEQERLEK